jgi:hypothetical protein
MKLTYKLQCHKGDALLLLFYTDIIPIIYTEPDNARKGLL